LGKEKLFKMLMSPKGQRPEPKKRPRGKLYRPLVVF